MSNWIVAPGRSLPPCGLLNVSFCTYCCRFRSASPSEPRRRGGVGVSGGRRVPGLGRRQNAGEFAFGLGLRRRFRLVGTPRALRLCGFDALGRIAARKRQGILGFSRDDGILRLAIQVGQLGAIGRPQGRDVRLRLHEDEPSRRLFALPLELSLSALELFRTWLEYRADCGPMMNAAATNPWKMIDNSTPSRREMAVPTTSSSW